MDVDPQVHVGPILSLEKLNPNPNDSFTSGVFKQIVCDQGAPSKPVH